jgi:chromosome segregation ATPase
MIGGRAVDTALQVILDALMESRAIIEAKLEGMDARLTGMDARLTNMEARLTSLDDKVTTIDTRLTNVEGKLDAVAADVSTIKGQLGEMNARDQFIIHKMSEVEGDVHVLKKLNNMKT